MNKNDFDNVLGAFIIGVMLTLLVMGFAISAMDKVIPSDCNTIAQLEKSNIHVTVDSECNFWLWNESLKCSTKISRDELNEISKKR